LQIPADPVWISEWPAPSSTKRTERLSGPAGVAKFRHKKTAGVASGGLTKMERAKRLELPQPLLQVILILSTSDSGRYRHSRTRLDAGEAGA